MREKVSASESNLDRRSVSRGLFPNLRGFLIRHRVVSYKPVAAELENEEKSMNDQFDELSKRLVQAVTRRAALRTFSIGMSGIVLACFNCPPF